MWDFSIFLTAKQIKFIKNNFFSSQFLFIYSEVQPPVIKVVFQDSIDISLACSFHSYSHGF